MTEWLEYLRLPDECEGVKKLEARMQRIESALRQYSVAHEMWVRWSVERTVAQICSLNYDKDLEIAFDAALLRLERKIEAAPQDSSLPAQAARAKVCLDLLVTILTLINLVLGSPSCKEAPCGEPEIPKPVRIEELATGSLKLDMHLEFQEEKRTKTQQFR